MVEGDSIGNETRKKDTETKFISLDQIALSFRVIPTLFNSPPRRD